MRKFIVCIMVLAFSAPAAFGWDGQDPCDFPVITGVAEIDGTISGSEWQGANWIDLAEDYYGTSPDLTDAKFAVMWSPVTNRIYIAVTGTDTDHNYAGYEGWNTQDGVEVYLDLTNSDDPCGIKPTDWQQIISCYNGSTIEHGYGGDVVIDEEDVTLDGDVITYEMSIVPYEVYSGTPMTLAVEQICGIEVIMASKHSGGFGMKCYYYHVDLEGKSSYPERLLDQKLSADTGCDPIGITGPVDPCGLVVYESASYGPTTGEFTVVLDDTPNASDTITVDIDPNSNGNGVDVSVSPTQLTFTSGDYSTPQTVTVTAINDTLADGYLELDEIGFTVTSAIGDPIYAEACLNSVGVTIIDDDSAGITVSKTSAAAAEGGAGDSYTVELMTPPTDPVTINVAAENLVVTSPTDSNMVPAPFDCQVTINGGGSASLVFNSGNYDTPQTVTVAAVDDGLYEADPHAITIGNNVYTDDVEY